MRLLLDTHTFLWFVNDNRELPTVNQRLHSRLPTQKPA